MRTRHIYGKILVVSITICICVLSVRDSSFADQTLVLFTGDKIKGRIIRRYSDRVKIKTLSGEKHFPIENIKHILEENWLSKKMTEARRALMQGRYREAQILYSQISSKSPEETLARERAYYLGRFLRKRRERYLKGSVTPSDAVMEDQRIYEDSSTGISLRRRADQVELSMSRGDPPDGLREGDVIVRICGRVAAEMQLSEIAALLINDPDRCDILLERSTLFMAGTSHRVNSDHERMLGATLYFTREGPVVGEILLDGGFSNAGLKKGDILISVDGVDIRHSDMADFLDAVTSLENGAFAEVVYRRRIQDENLQ